MSSTTPKYGMRVPDGSTYLASLGIELLEMGLDIESVLAGFDYNGADPNLVLSRVAALEAANRETAWVNLRTLAGISTSTWSYGGTQAQIKRVGKRVYLRGSLTNNTAYINFTQIGTLPAGWRPASAGNITMNLGTDNVAAKKQARIVMPGGALQVHATAAALAWYFDGLTWETADTWPAGY